MHIMSCLAAGGSFCLPRCRFGASGFLASNMPQPQPNGGAEVCIFGDDLTMN